MAIEILKRERAALRKKARAWDARHPATDGQLSVRTWNLLRQAASLTVAILILKHTGGMA